MPSMTKCCMSNSSPCRSWHSLAFALLAAVQAGCSNDPPPDPRFLDPSSQRPNDSKKLTVVFVDGVAVPAASASEFRKTRLMESAVAPGMGPAGPRQPAASPGAGSPPWDLPASWSAVPPSSPVRMAEYRVPASQPGGETAEVAVFFLGPSDAAVDDTLQRWASSFDAESAGKAKRWERRDGLHPAYLVEVEGTFLGATTMAPEGAKPPSERPGWRMIGAIVQVPLGPYYFKMIGPKQTVEAARNDFLSLIDSVGRTASGSAPAASGSAPAASGSALPAASR